MIIEKRKIIDLVLRLKEPIESKDVIHGLELIESIQIAEQDILNGHVIDTVDLEKEVETWFNQ